ncbi:MAG TPA: ATP-binding protein [Kouleothrix sp.]|jgi:signal transduction histidine kinase|nr:ATP-binding protein [Kouleothrix sp.]
MKFTEPPYIASMSLRRRLTISYVGFFAVALIFLDIGLYLIVRQALLSSIDNELRLGAQLLQQEFDASNQQPHGYFDGEQWLVRLRAPQVQNFETTSLIVQAFLFENGELQKRSSDAQVNLEPNPALLQSALDGTTPDPIVNKEGLGLRELYTPVLFRGKVIGAFQIARSMKSTDLALKLLFYALLGGGVIVLLAAARGGDWLTRAAFRPIDEVTRTAQSIVRAEDLSLRVPVPPTQDELQRLTITVNDLLARLEVLFSAQRRFVADVSHELRTPLAAMQGNLEVLDRGAARDPELLAESLADMRREVARLIRMANDLLLLAQSEAGIQLHYEPVELDTLLLEVHRDLRPLTGGVQLHIGEEDQIVVQGDRDRLKQALLNLGINALQHTAPGGSVTLSLAQHDGVAELSVADTGAGIAAEDVPHIFERFYRADRARSRNRGGAGLGLPIVKWIAEAHGGQVHVTSTPGVGSRFSITLPIELQPEAMPALQFVHSAAAPS